MRAEFVEFIPESLEPAVLYVSRKYKTAAHLCCCGCGTRVVTPLKAGGWRLNNKGGVTLSPSIGNWALACQSHYWIRKGKVVWAPKWTKEEIDAGRLRDQRDREHALSDRPVSLWSRIRSWFR